MTASRRWLVSKGRGWYGSAGNGLVVLQLVGEVRSCAVPLCGSSPAGMRMGRRRSLAGWGCLTRVADGCSGSRDRWQWGRVLGSLGVGDGVWQHLTRAQTQASQEYMRLGPCVLVLLLWWGWCWADGGLASIVWSSLTSAGPGLSLVPGCGSGLVGGRTCYSLRINTCALSVSALVLTLVPTVCVWAVLVGGWQLGFRGSSL